MGRLIFRSLTFLAFYHGNRLPVASPVGVNYRNINDNNFQEERYAVMADRRILKAIDK